MHVLNCRDNRETDTSLRVAGRGDLIKGLLSDVANESLSMEEMRMISNEDDCDSWMIGRAAGASNQRMS